MLEVNYGDVHSKDYEVYISFIYNNKQIEIGNLYHESSDEWYVEIGGVEFESNLLTFDMAYDWVKQNA